MTNLSVFAFEGHQIRWIDGKPVANDVAAALGYADPAKTVSTKVFAQNKTVTKTVTVDGKHREITVLEEGGIYQLIFGSKLASAQSFQQWVFDEVLPSIRKTGSYGKPTFTYAWTERLKLFRRKTKIPTGWFCIFEELNNSLVGDLEDHGIILPGNAVPDISVGKCFCKHLRATGRNTDDPRLIRKYRHFYPDGRIVDANIYVDKLLPEYRQWFNVTYRPDKFVTYLKGKDPSLLPTYAAILGLPEGSL